MKVLILAGGFGTRLSEETELRPKPMVEIGGRPILWHIMKGYAAQGFREFVGANKMHVHNSTSEDWTVTLLDTGLETMTGGRVRRARQFLDGKRFMLTYGDGVSNVDLAALLDFHDRGNRLMTLTAVQPEGRFGALVQSPDGLVSDFKEKPVGDGAWINGGFFVCEPAVLDYIAGDATIFEREPMERLAADAQLAAYRHTGFWKCMDTLRDKTQLSDLWASGRAPWKNWTD
jgi:glucose-1-phosphate cytidylyltransferase